MKKRFSHKLCRRYGVKLCQSDKCPIVRRNYPPGAHGPKGHRRTTEFGLQLAEKQKAKAVYGIAERQFRNYYQKAIRKIGNTGEFLVQLLEMRLDNVVYRAGLAKTRPQARQMVNHGFFEVNGKKVNIPSYQVKAKDEITIRTQKASSKLFAQPATEKKETPSWMTVDQTAKKVKVLGSPKMDEIEQIFNTRLIVEFYSR